MSDAVAKRPGAKKIYDTRIANKLIADVLVVSDRFAAANPQTLMKFLEGWLEGVEFIKNQEFETLAVLDDLPVAQRLAGQQQFQHHEVGKENVGRRGHNLVTCFVVVLAGVPLECHLAFEARSSDPRVKLLKLAIGERIHGIDHDCPGALRLAGRFCAQHTIDDRNEVAERLARTRARRDDKALALICQRDGVKLVLMQQEGTCK